MLFLSLAACSQEQKIKGLSLVGASRLPDESTWLGIQNLGANAVTLMPYAYSEKGDSKLISYTDWQWVGESYQGIISCSAKAQSLGLQVMIKPHIWIVRGGFTGTMSFDSPEKRKAWNQQYIDYITRFAALADSLGHQSFCLATEMESMWKESPEDFQKLIRSVRKVFKGQITYAANWDEYNRFPFWDRLDVIGIDAYFPLGSEKEASKRWKDHWRQIEALSDSLNKKVLFTELGYRSTENPFAEPWVSDTDVPVSETAQSQAWKIFFDELWNEDALLGVYVWKWFPNMKKPRENNGFTPQGKDAEAVIKHQFQE